MKVVLDTNVVLDWLVFGDPRIEKLRHDFASQRTVLMSHPLANTELQRVLAYPTLNLSTEQQAAVLAQYVAHSQSLVMPAGFSSENLLLPAKFPKCRDRDDQFWFALAYHGNADALISRDQKVLTLAKRVAPFEIRIMTYDDYNAV